MILVLVKAVENLFDFHVYLIDMLNSGSDLTSTWILSKLRMNNLFIIGFGLWLHRFFHLGKLLHEATILFTIVAESRYILLVVPCISLSLFTLDIITINIAVGVEIFTLSHRNNIGIF